MDEKDYIRIEISLDAQRIPEKIQWTASGQESEKEWKEAKAFFLTLFDPETRDTMQMDLWTKKMQVIEMDRFVFQTLNVLSDLYFRSTRNTSMANEMRQFAKYFGQQIKLIE